MYVGHRTDLDEVAAGWDGAANEPDPALVDLTAAVERFTGAEHETRGHAALGEDLRQLRHLIDLLEMSFAERTKRFVETNCDDDFAPREWIRHECRMSVSAGQRAMAVGEQLQEMPEAAESLRQQRIGYEHLALLCSTAQAVGDVSGQPFDTRSLLRQAEEHSVSRFRFDCAHARHAADAAGFLSDHLDAVEARGLELVPCPGGSLLQGQLDTVASATLRSALEPLARRSGAGDVRPRSRRLADALVELAERVLDSGALPEYGGQRPHLQVTATLETLRGVRGSAAGELQFAGPVPAATVQRLACDAAVTRVVFDPKSVIVDVGRARRVPGAPARKALIARDGRCVWPGCDRSAPWTQAHHLVFWAADGGTTDTRNLVLLCHRHHWMVHEGGWQLSRDSEGRVLTVPPLPRRVMQGGYRPPPAEATPTGPNPAEAAAADLPRGSPP